MKVGYVYDPIYLRHDTGPHVEVHQRLEAILAHLEKTGLKQKLTHVAPRPATIDEIALVHHRQYIAHIQEMALRGGGWLDVDTLMSADSYDAALYAAGGVITGADRVMTGELNSAFALVRPPGHHATYQQAMGFCLFNNIAIAARYALNRYSLDRIAIIDFDVHHGNGTQEAFYEDPKVSYISTHQHPHYPGTGTIEETGSGKGKGNTINVPMPIGCGDSEYALVYEQIVKPAVRRFKPQLIMVSAGYDAHWADELSMEQLSVTGFARIMRTIRELAEELCQGRLVLTLEGGYNLRALAESVKATFDALLGSEKIDDTLGPPPYRVAAPNPATLIEAVKKLHDLH